MLINKQEMLHWYVLFIPMLFCDRLLRPKIVDNLYITNYKGKLRLEPSTLENLSKQRVIIHKRTLFLFKDGVYYTLAISQKDIEIRLVIYNVFQNKELGFLKSDMPSFKRRVVNPFGYLNTPKQDFNDKKNNEKLKPGAKNVWKTPKISDFSRKKIKNFDKQKDLLSAPPLTSKTTIKKEKLKVQREQEIPDETDDNMQENEEESYTPPVSPQKKIKRSAYQPSPVTEPMIPISNQMDNPGKLHELRMNNMTSMYPERFMDPSVNALSPNMYPLTNSDISHQIQSQHPQIMRSMELNINEGVPRQIQAQEHSQFMHSMTPGVNETIPHQMQSQVHSQFMHSMTPNANEEMIRQMHSHLMPSLEPSINEPIHHSVADIIPSTKPRSTKKNNFLIESDSKIDNHEFNYLIKNVTVEEIDHEYFKLKAKENACVTYYKEGFIFTPCSLSENQLFRLEKAEDAIKKSAKVLQETKKAENVFKKEKITQEKEEPEEKEEYENKIVSDEVSYQSSKPKQPNVYPSQSSTALTTDKNFDNNLTEKPKPQAIKSNDNNLDKGSTVDNQPSVNVYQQPSKAEFKPGNMFEKRHEKQNQAEKHRFKDKLPIKKANSSTKLNFGEDFIESFKKTIQNEEFNDIF